MPAQCLVHGVVKTGVLFGGGENQPYLRTAGAGQRERGARQMGSSVKNAIIFGKDKRLRQPIVQYLDFPQTTTLMDRTWDPIQSSGAQTSDKKMFCSQVCNKIIAQAVLFWGIF